MTGDVVISHDLPEVPLEDLLQRYKSERRRARMAPHYEAMLAEARQRAEPAALHAEFPAANLAALDGYLPEPTTAAVLGLCTLGPGLEARVKALFEEDPMLAVVLDEITLELANAMARSLHRDVRREAAGRGLKAGPAYRPGIGRWPLQAQAALFDLLPASRIGVSLDEHLLMRPLKTISVIIPLRREEKSQTSSQ